MSTIVVKAGVSQPYAADTAERQRQPHRLRCHIATTRKGTKNAQQRQGTKSKKSKHERTQQDTDTMRERYLRAYNFKAGVLCTDAAAVDNQKPSSGAAAPELGCASEDEVSETCHMKIFYRNQSLVNFPKNDVGRKNLKLALKRSGAFLIRGGDWGDTPA